MTIPDGGATQPGGWPGRRRAAKTARVHTPPGLKLVAGGFCVLLSPVFGWALGGGTPGIFVARDVDCHHGCHWFGDFMSSDRRLAVRDVQYAGNAPGMKAGTVIGVKDINSALFRNIVFPRHAALRDILWISIWPEAVLALLLLLIFARWIWTVPVRYWREPR